MFSLFGNSREEQMKKDLLVFLAEMEKNLEFYYVMDQRQFITHGFLTDFWPKVRDFESIKKYQSILTYGKAIEDFNNAYKTYKDFETWYTSDVNNKTPENSKKLHALKHGLDHKVQEMESIIILAGQDLEREMLNLGLLKT